MATNNWRCDFVEMKKLLNQLNAYVECGDWTNAHRISNILQFKVKFCHVYEQENRRALNYKEAMKNEKALHG